MQFPEGLENTPFSKVFLVFQLSFPKTCFEPDQKKRSFEEKKNNENLLWNKDL